MKVKKISTALLIVFFLTTSYLSCVSARKIRDRMRMIGGKKANSDDFKFIVAVLTGQDLCGGAIINEHYVLTAAHCYLKENNQFVNGTKVIAGTDDLYDYQDSRRLELEVENIFVPRSYQPHLYVDDIAVLKLKQSLNLKLNNLTKLELPAIRRENYIGRRASIAGFGSNEVRLLQNNQIETHTDGKLYFTDVQVLNETECQYVDSAAIFCGRMIGDEKLDRYGLCFGDSGSPLVYASKIVIGIASYGYDGEDDACNEKEFNMLYTKVTSFLDFIYNVVTESDMTEVRDRNSEVLVN